MPEFLSSCVKWRDEAKQKGMLLVRGDTDSRAI